MVDLVDVYCYRTTLLRIAERPVSTYVEAVDKNVDIVLRVLDIVSGRCQHQMNLGK